MIFILYRTKFAIAKPNVVSAYDILYVGLQLCITRHLAKSIMVCCSNVQSLLAFFNPGHRTLE